MKYLAVIGSFWVLAAVVFVAMMWGVPALYSGTPNASSGFNYGTSFVVPFSHSFAPWIAGVIVVLGPLVSLRAAIDSRSASPRRGSRRRG